MSRKTPRPRGGGNQSISGFKAELLRCPPAPHLLAVVRVVAEAQAAVIGDLRQVFVVELLQADVLRRPGEQTRSDSKDRAPERVGSPRALWGSWS